MDNTRSVITKKKKLDQNKISKAKGLSKREQTTAIVKQEQKLKGAKKIVQEFDEWE